MKAKAKSIKPKPMKTFKQNFGKLELGELTKIGHRQQNLILDNIF